MFSGQHRCSGSQDGTPERNLSLYRDALSKVRRLVYVRNLDGGEDICPGLGGIDRLSGEGCCKGKYRLVEASNRYLPLRCVFKFQLVKLAKRRTCSYVVSTCAQAGQYLRKYRPIFAQIGTLFTPTYNALQNCRLTHNLGRRALTTIELGG
jgi:hypothetical protein